MRSDCPAFFEVMSVEVGRSAVDGQTLSRYSRASVGRQRAWDAWQLANKLGRLEGWKVGKHWRQTIQKDITRAGVAGKR